MTTGRLLYLIQHNIKRGWSATWHDYAVAPKIWKTPPSSNLGLLAKDVPVHVLCGHKQFPLLPWMVKSFFHFSKASWKIVIHDDGTLTREDKKQWLNFLPNTEIIARKEADEEMNHRLHDFPSCRKYRDQHPLALKIFDAPALCDYDRFILLDSDVLFFKPPAEITQWVTSGSDELWFNEDCQDGLNITEDEAEESLGLDLWPKVNSGLCLLNRDAFSLDDCENYLNHSDIMHRKEWRIEQTLFALSASKYDKGGLLPQPYEVSLKKERKGTSVSRHYVGAVRQEFYGEGIRDLKATLL